MTTFRQRFASILAAAPDLGFAGVCLWAWVSGDSPALVRQIVLLMLLEFIVLHSAAFMGTRLFGAASAWKKARDVALLAGFYSLFVLGFALAFETWWPMIAFWALSLNRLLGSLLRFGEGAREQARIAAGWAAGALFYLVGVFVTVLLPIPRLGITRAVRDAADLPGEGAWVDDPHRVVVFAMLYFAAMGATELTAHRWLRAGANPAVIGKAAR